MKKLLATALAALTFTTVASVVGALSPYDKIPPVDPTNFKPGPLLKDWLRDVPFVRDTFMVEFDEANHLVYVLPRTLINPVHADKGIRFVRYQ